jgi:peptidoglycan/xylan/chitin deacetylase (PgdA/CDA1 family)
VFKNHEIAVHGTYHKALVGLSDKEILEEINVDIENLTILSDRKISSMAYAFGSTNDHVAEVIGTTPLTNARTTKSSYNFDLPEDYYLWNPTCHDSEALEYLEAYISLDSPSLSLFHVWGHSWEFRDTLRNRKISKFCSEIGLRDDIWYISAGDFADYHASLKALEIGPKQIINPEGNGVVYYREKGQLKSLDPGQRLTH